MIEHNLDAPSPEPLDQKREFTDAQLRELGISSRAHMTYEWNGYRYSNAADAVAAAKRGAR